LAIKTALAITMKAAMVMPEKRHAVYCGWYDIWKSIVDCDKPSSTGGGIMLNRVVLLITLCLFVAACGGSTGDEVSGGTDDGAVSTNSAVPAPGPQNSPEDVHRVWLEAVLNRDTVALAETLIEPPIATRDVAAAQQIDMVYNNAEREGIVVNAEAVELLPQTRQNGATVDGVMVWTTPDGITPYCMTVEAQETSDGWRAANAGINADCDVVVEVASGYPLLRYADQDLRIEVENLPREFIWEQATILVNGVDQTEAFRSGMQSAVQDDVPLGTYEIIIQHPELPDTGGTVVIEGRYQLLEGSLQFGETDQQAEMRYAQPD
jgi:hypothetical protein